MIKLGEREQMVTIDLIYGIADLIICNYPLAEVKRELEKDKVKLFRYCPEAWEVYLNAFWRLASVFAVPHKNTRCVDIEVGNGDVITFFTNEECV